MKASGACMSIAPTMQAVQCCSVAGTSQYFDGDDKGAAGLAGEAEMYPYVSFTISVDG